MRYGFERSDPVGQMDELDRVRLSSSLPLDHGSSDRYGIGRTGQMPQSARYVNRAGEHHNRDIRK